MKTLLAVLLLASTPVAAQPYICLQGDAGDAMDKLRDEHGEVPILQMTMAGGYQSFLIAGPDGHWLLLTRMPGGSTCILGIGDGMKKATADQRFLEERSE